MKRTGSTPAALAIAIALGAGCSSDETVQSSSAGTKGAACLPKGGCDIGLTCKDGKCQATGSGGASGSAGAGATGGGGSSGSGGSTGGSAGSGGGSGSGGSTGGGAGSGGGAGTSTDSGADAAACVGSHPLLDGGARFCGVGDCYCDTDRCFAQSEAATCCTGNFTCFGPDGGVACTGSHPLVDGSARFCGTGDCYCSSRDTCFASAIAAICCDVTPSCT